MNSHINEESFITEQLMQSEVDLVSQNVSPRNSDRAKKMKNYLMAEGKESLKLSSWQIDLDNFIQRQNQNKNAMSPVRKLEQTMNHIIRPDFELKRSFTRASFDGIEGYQEWFNQTLGEFVQVRERSDVEIIDVMDNRYPWLEMLKALLRIKYGISRICEIIINASVFEAFIILVIITNTVIQAMDADSGQYTTLENIFLYIYTGEWFLKIWGMGFIRRKGAYWREPWNILDFVIVVSGWVEILAGGGVTLVALRALRILRPLRSVSHIQGLRTTFLSLVGAIPGIMETVLILVFFFLIFAIAGVQLWMGILRARWLDLETGQIGDEEDIWGHRECHNNQIWVNGLSNPNYGFTNFDNILYAFLIVFQWVTLEGWTHILVMVQKAFSPFVVIYFVPLVFIGAFFLLNLTLAVIKTSFTEVLQEQKKKNQDQDLEVEEEYIQRARIALKRITESWYLGNWNENEEADDSQVIPDVSAGLDSVNLEPTTQRPPPERLTSTPNAGENPHSRLDTKSAAKIVPISLPLSDSVSKSFIDWSNQASFRSKSSMRQQQAMYTSVNINQLNGGMVVHDESPKLSQTESCRDESEVEPEMQPDTSQSGSSQPKNVSQADLEIWDTEDADLPMLEKSLSQTLQVYDIDYYRQSTKFTEDNKRYGRRNTSQTLEGIESRYKILVTFDGVLEDSTSMTDVCPYLSQQYKDEQRRIMEQNIVSQYFTFSYSDDAPSELNQEPIESKDESQMDKKVKGQNEEDVESLAHAYNILALRIDEMEAYKSIVFIAKDHIDIQTVCDENTNRIVGEWSGKDVSPENEDAEAYKNSVSLSDYYIWGTGWSAKAAKIKKMMYILVESRMFNNLMTICVVLNTIVLATDHHGISEEWEEINNNMNFAFTIIFALEMILKFIGHGFTGYFRDQMNYVDATVVILSLFEIIFLGDNSSITAFRTIRVFRTFRVLRVARLFRYLKSMDLIIRRVSDSIQDFAFLALLLLLFTLIFALLGMQIFGGKFDFPEGTPRANFDSFHWAFITVFQVMSMENWQNIQFNGMRSDAGPWSWLYFIFWIFVGNFVILNSFLAILLDRFSDESRDTNAEIEEEVEAELGNEATYAAMLNRKSSGHFYALSKKKQKERLAEIYAIMEEKGYEEDDYQSFKRSIGNLWKQWDDICDRSYYIFSKYSPFRIICYRISTHRFFENVILLLICLSSLKLVWDTYIMNEPDDSTEAQASFALDVLFTCLFTIELLIKSISVGLVLDKNSYLRESWNQLDMFIVVFSWVEFMVAEVDIPVIKILRLLRTLRPLRFISHNLSMKIVVIALLESVGAIVNTIIVILLVWLMFAILGVSLFSGKFYSCSVHGFDSKDACEDAGHTWENADSNFDNLYEAIITLFVISSLEGWPQIMLQAVDSTDHDQAPIRNNEPMMAYFFVIFLLIGAFFFLNVFIAVIFEQYTKSKKGESAISMYLRQDQRRWVEIMKLIPKEAPDRQFVQEDKSMLRQAFVKVTKSNIFEMFIMFCIIGNMLLMAITYDGSSAEYQDALEIINTAFTGIFILEATIKLIGLGPKDYFHSTWNRFDFCIVIASILEFMLELFSGSDFSLLRLGPQLIRVVRVLRVTRMFRLVRALKGIQSLIQTMIYSMPFVLNVLSLLLLIFFIYSILGVFLFHETQTGKVLDEYTNFSNFGMAMIALLRISTGEEWNIIMYDFKDGWTAPLYFLSFVVITSFVMLNMFIMVILQQYDDHHNNPRSPLEIFKTHVKHFKKTWSIYSYNYGGFRIKNGNFIDFMRDLPEPLGIAYDTPKIETERIKAVLDLYVDEDGFIYFYDVLYHLLRRNEGKFNFTRRTQDKFIKKMIEKEERAVKAQIQNKIEKFQNSILNRVYKKDRGDFEEDIKTSMFVSMILMRNILGRWHRYAYERKLMREDGITPSQTSSDDSSEDDEVASLAQVSYKQVPADARRQTINKPQNYARDAEFVNRRIQRRSIQAPQISNGAVPRV